jgi:hypothetical protein
MDAERSHRSDRSNERKGPKKLRKGGRNMKKERKQRDERRNNENGRNKQYNKLKEERKTSMDQWIWLFESNSITPSRNKYLQKHCSFGLQLCYLILCSYK